MLAGDLDGVLDDGIGHVERLAADEKAYLQADAHRLLWVAVARTEDLQDAVLVDRQPGLLEPARQRVEPVLVADRLDRKQDAVMVEWLAVGEQLFERST